MGVLIRIPILGNSLNEWYAFRQTQTAIQVREMIRGSLVGSGPIPIFGSQDQVPMEFPLFQVVGALLGREFGLDSSTASRLSGLIFFQISAVLIYLLATKWFDRRVGISAILLFEFSPYGVQWGSAALIECLPTAAVLGSLLCVDQWVRHRNRLWLAAAGIASLIAFLVKPTTAIPWVLLQLLALVAVTKGSGLLNRARLQTIAVGLIPTFLGVIAASVWTIYADHIKSQSVYTEFLTSSNLSSWNYGTLQQRLEFSNWLNIVDHSPNSGISILLLLSPLVALWVWKQQRTLLVGLALVYPVAVAIFFNLYNYHAYYGAAVFPSLVLVEAAAIVGLANRFLPHKFGPLTAYLATALLILFTWFTPEGLRVRENLASVSTPPEFAVQLQKATSASDTIVIVGCDWDPTVPYFADRHALMIRQEENLRQIPAGVLDTDRPFIFVCATESNESYFANQFPAGTRFERIDANLYRVIG